MSLQARWDLLRKLSPVKLAARVPAWAKPSPIKRFEFVPNQPPRYPGGLTTVASNESHRAWVFKLRFTAPPADPREYAAHWDKANGLKPVPIIWVRPSLGCFG